MIEMNVFLMLQSFGLGSSQAAPVVLSLNELFRSTMRSVVTMYTTSNFQTFLLVALFPIEHLKVGSCGGGWWPLILYWHLLVHPHSKSQLPAAWQLNHIHSHSKLFGLDDHYCQALVQNPQSLIKVPNFRSDLNSNTNFYFHFYSAKGIILRLYRLWQNQAFF